MAQLSVIPGSATTWTGERNPGTAAAGVGEDALALGPTPPPGSGDAEHPPQEGGGWVKWPRWTLRASGESRQRHYSRPALPPRQGDTQMLTDAGSRARARGAALAPPPAAHWLLSVTSRSAIKIAARGSRGAEGTRGRGRSRSREQGGRTLGRGLLSDVLLRAPHRGRPQGDGHAGGGVAAAAAPDEAGCAVHPQGLRRPAAPGRPQEAGLVQGHGEPRGHARLGIPARGGPSPSCCACSPWARPLPLSLSHRPGPFVSLLICFRFLSIQQPSASVSLRIFYRSFSSLRPTGLCLLPSYLLALEWKRLPRLLAPRSPFLPIIRSTEFDRVRLQPRNQGSLTGCLAGPMTQTKVTPSGCEKERTKWEGGFLAVIISRSLLLDPSSPCVKSTSPFDFSLIFLWLSILGRLGRGERGVRREGGGGGRGEKGRTWRSPEP